MSARSILTTRPRVAGSHGAGVTLLSAVERGIKPALGRNVRTYLTADEALELAADLIAAAELAERPAAKSGRGNWLEHFRPRTGDELRPFAERALEIRARRYDQAASKTEDAHREGITQ